MSIVPLYLYGSYEVPEVGDGALFHYTKFKGLLAILETMTLRSSPLSRMNDLNEADLSGLNWNRDFLFMNNAQSYVRNKCSVISFSQNYEYDSVCHEGSNHPALWAHYAQDSEGACIVLDKNALIDVNQDHLGNLFYRLEDVKYTCDHNPRLGVMDEKYADISEFIHANYRKIFFKKYIDWSNEDEVRFLIESPECFLNIMGAIKYIVLGKRLVDDVSKMQELLKHICNPSYKCFKYFNPHSFACMSNSQGGYFTGDASHHILNYLECMVKCGLLMPDLAYSLYPNTLN